MVSDLKTFTKEGCKIAKQKKFVFLGEFCLTEQYFFGIGATIHIGQEFLCSHLRDFEKHNKIQKKSSRKKNHTRMNLKLDGVGPVDNRPSTN